MIRDIFVVIRDIFVVNRDKKNHDNFTTKRSRIEDHESIVIFFFVRNGPNYLVVVGGSFIFSMYVPAFYLVFSIALRVSEETLNRGWVCMGWWV